MEVRASWSRAGAAPERWSAPDWVAGRLAEVELETAQGTRPAEIDAEGRLLLPAGTRSLRYVYPLEGALRGGLQSGVGSPGGYLINGRTYLLVPERLAASAEVLLEADPAQCLLPWELEGGRARVQVRDLRRRGYHTFGGRRHTLENAHGRLELAILPGASSSQEARYVRWVRRSWEELLGCAPRYAVPRLALTVVPTSGRGVGFGQLLRSRPPSIAIYAGARASERELRRDWVAIHELSHSLHPEFWPKVNWLTEGLATYYQCLARIRSGRLAPSEAWAQLVRGVTSGRRQAGGLDLAQLSRDMHRTHRYRTVYWGGALVVLELDLAIRRASGERGTLDDVLANLCSRGPRARLEDFAAEVDRVAGQPVYAEVARRHLHGEALAETDALLEQLGIRDQRPLTLLADGPSAELRRALESNETR